MTAELKHRCENFHIVNGIMYQCCGGHLPFEATFLQDGFFSVAGEQVWVCDLHRFIDLTGMDG